MTLTVFSGAHPIPSQFGVDEAMLKEHFLPYGLISSVRICRSPSTVRGASDDHAFVRFNDTRGAERALRDPNSCVILGQRMVVKVADADVAPKLKSGMSESEWIYCRGLPPNIPADDVLNMFSQFGRILDMKYFASTAMYKGTGALLRYTCVENAKAAINVMNDTTFPGCFQPLLVRFADSPAEKAAKMTRKDLHAKNNARTQPLRDAMISMANAIRSHGSGESDALGSLPSGEYQGSPGPRSYISTGSDVLAADVVPSLEGHALQAPQSRIVSVSGLPEQCDKLWVYENFAVFGAIVGVTMGKKSGSSSATTTLSLSRQPSDESIDDAVKARGAARSSPGSAEATITYVSHHEAAKARDAMHGLRVGNATISALLEYSLPDPGMLASMSRALSAMHQQQQQQQQQHLHQVQQLQQLQQLQQHIIPQHYQQEGQQHGRGSPPRSRTSPPGSPGSAHDVVERMFPDSSQVDGLRSVTNAMNLMNLSPYSSGFSDMALSELVSQLSAKQNENGGGI